MIDPRTVLVAIPSYSGSVVAELAGTLIMCSRMFGAVSFRQGVAHVSLARNYIAHSFLQSKFEWLVCIDDDIVFMPRDFEILLEPRGPYYKELPTDENIARQELRAVESEGPTLVRAMGLSDTFDPRGERGVSTLEADAIVCAEYSYKNDALEPVRRGLGFTRIHRSVFEAIRELKHEDGSPRTWTYIAQGQQCTDFYPSGSLYAQIVPNAAWVGEDHGFFTLAALAGFVPRIETRTRLVHIGKKGFPYVGDGAGAN